MRIAVLGAGNGGFATAADLALRGHEIHLFELEDFSENLEAVRRSGGIHLDTLQSFPRPGGFAKIALTTTDMGAAVEGADLILLTVPAFTHSLYAKLLAPHLRDGQVVVLCPGYLGPVLFAQEIVKAGGRILSDDGSGEDSRGILLAETESLIYACRKTAPDRVWARGYKQHLRVAALTASATSRVTAILREAYPDVEPAENIIETSLSNANALIHTPLMLLNAAHIERTRGDFLFYHEGMTPKVGELIEKLDEERLAIGEAWGVRLRTMFEQDYGWYAHQGAQGPTIYHTHVTNPIYRWSKAPESLSHRYVGEDIPFGMVPMESLARKAGLSTPRITAMIELFSAIMDRNFREEGRTLEALGFGEHTLEEVRAALEGRTAWFADAPTSGNDPGTEPNR